jgi:hypothetical protein
LNRFLTALSNLDQPRKALNGLKQLLNSFEKPNRFEQLSRNLQFLKQSQKAFNSFEQPRKD